MLYVALPGAQKLHRGRVLLLPRKQRLAQLKFCYLPLNFQHFALEHEQLLSLEGVELRNGGLDALVQLILDVMGVLRARA
jgi:hypothetical protein